MRGKKRIEIADAGEIQPGKGKKIVVGDQEIALFQVGRKYYALQNACPHQGGDLAEGYIREGKVYCPLHNWAFYLHDGSYAFNHLMKLKTYSVSSENNRIYIEIE